MLNNPYITEGPHDLSRFEEAHCCLRYLPRLPRICERRAYRWLDELGHKGRGVEKEADEFWEVGEADPPERGKEGGGNEGGVKKGVQLQGCSGACGLTSSAAPHRAPQSHRGESTFLPCLRAGPQSRARPWV